MPPRVARLVGYGAFAACLGILALYALLFWVFGSGRFAGLDGTLSFLSRFTLAGVIVALIIVHVMLGRRLLDMAGGKAELP